MPAPLTPRGADLDAAILAGNYAPPTTGNQFVILSGLIARGVLTAAGAYAAGKSRPDVETVLVLPEPVDLIVTEAAKTVYGV